MLLHDAAVLDDPALVESVAAGAGLAVTNARMQADARERVDALVASRQRLVEAGETQRRRFGRELHDAVETRLDAARRTLWSNSKAAASCPQNCSTICSPAWRRRGASYATWRPGCSLAS